jgi:hypothetical protein
MALPWGAAVQGANTGIDRGVELARAFQIAQLRDLQLREAEQEMAERAKYRALIPQILSAAPETATVGGVAPRPTGQLAPGEDPEAGAFIGATPAIPGTTIAAPTMGGLTRQLGPENMAAVVARPEGRDLLKSQGVVTDATFQARKKRAEAMEEFKKFGQDMEAKYAAGDPLGGLLAERAGYRALAMAADDPTPLLGKANELTKEFARESERAKKDKDYKAALERDGQAYAKAMGAYLEAQRQDREAASKGQPGGRAAAKAHELLAASAQWTSDWGGKKRDGLFAGIEKGIAKSLTQEPTTLYAGAIAAAMNQQVARGQALDYTAAVREATRAHPEAIGAMIEAATSGKGGKLSEAMLEAWGIGGTPKNEYHEAHQTVVAQGIPSGDPRYIAAFTRALTALKKSREKPEKPAAGDTKEQTRHLLQLHRDLTSEINSKRRERAQAKKDILNNDPEGVKALDAEIRAAEAQRADVRKQYLVLTNIKLTEEENASAGGKTELATTPPAGDLKSRRDAAVAALFKGRTWDTLKTAEKAKVVDRLNASQ